MQQTRKNQGSDRGRFAGVPGGTRPWGWLGDPRIEVVGKASNAFEARDKILETNPDILTCDIQMPRMDGIEFIRRLLSQYPIPRHRGLQRVGRAVFDAMNAGAVEFVTKPDEKERQGRRGADQGPARQDRDRLQGAG